MTARIERLSQRQLVYELRAAIDTAIRDEGWSRSLRTSVSRPARGRVPGDLERVRTLVADHPHALRARHVQHNLGRNRLRWLRDLLMAGSEDDG